MCYYSGQQVTSKSYSITIAMLYAYTEVEGTLVSIMAKEMQLYK